jgi:hypothetical protein
MWHLWDKQEINKKNWSEKLKGRVHSGIIGVDEKF